MKYNKQKLDEFVSLLGMKNEVRRLFYAGLNYPTLAKVIYQTFNPENLSSKLKIKKIFANNSNSKTNRNFEIVMNYHGINLKEKLTLAELGEKFSISYEAARKSIVRFDNSVLPNKEIQKRFSSLNKSEKIDSAYFNYETEGLKKDASLIQPILRRYQMPIKKELYNNLLESILLEDQSA